MERSCPTQVQLGVVLVRWSVTIESVSSNSGSTGEERKPKASGFSQSSTVVAAAPLKPNGTTELHAAPLRAGDAARRLLAEDEREAKEQLFSHLPETYSLAHRLRRHGWSTLRYLMQTEVHTYAFSVAANSILSLFPFIVLLLTVVRRVFHSTAMYNVVLELLRDYLPSNKDFVIRNLQFLASVKGRGQVLSLVMLLITSTGIFLPLEVALNSIWGFTQEPLLPDEPGRVARPGSGMRLPGNAFDRADRRRTSRCSDSPSVTRTLSSAVWDSS